MKIVLDVWVGHNHQDHAARFIRDFNDAIDIARTELEVGNLVNLRGEIAWGEFLDFDNRKVGRG